MAIKTIHECDICGARCECDAIYAVVDRIADSAGGMEDVHESVDLCPIHMRMLMAWMVAEMDHDQAAAWAKRAKTKPVPVRV